MKVALVAAEMAPYAKAGGLADVIGALPAALAECGARVSVVIPGYRCALAALRTATVGGEYRVRVGNQDERFRLRSGIGPGGVAVFLIEHDGYFGRDGIYGEGGRDYPDSIARYVFFGRAAAQVLADFIRPGVVHSHDWHSAVLPIVMRADPQLHERFAGTASLFTIHNVAFQGLCDAAQFALLNIDPAYFSIDYLEFYGQINLMKGAVVMADAASTVSPTYAREISSDPAFGFGLEGVLRAKGPRFVGILNGADYSEWNPATDHRIAARFGPGDTAGKAVCAAALRERAGFDPKSRRALIGMVSRMTAQKGFDLLAAALDDLMELEVDLIVLGSGEPQFERRLRAAERTWPRRVRLSTAFDNDLAHQIQAGCDMFLMPSRFEPCGLTQMYALKYGTAPIVRATGGLADTVVEFDPSSESGNGFVFNRYERGEMIGAIGRALDIFGRPRAWKRLMANCFAADFSWSAAASRYMELYRQLRADRTR